MASKTGTLAEGILIPISTVGKDLEGYKKDPHCTETTSNNQLIF